MGSTSTVGWLKMAKENMESLESLVEETELDMTGTGAHQDWNCALGNLGVAYKS